MKKKVMLLLSLSFMLGLGAFAQDVAELPVKTIKGISVAMNGADTVAVFGITEAYGNTEDSFKALACVVPKGNLFEAGICYSKGLKKPTFEDGDARVVYAKPFDIEKCVHGVVLNNLIDGSTYYYRVYVREKGSKNYLYGKVYVSTTLPTANYCPDSNHPHAIDLGLPSGKKWACCNVGAFSPNDYGGYYAWGETMEKTSYTLENYAYGNNEYDCINLGNNISNTSYDAARNVMGAPWCMPTIADFKELDVYCTLQKDAYGCLFTGSNGNCIYVPAAGYISGSKIKGARPIAYGGEGRYYTGTLSNDASRARILNFGGNFFFWETSECCVGCSIRAICE